MIRNYSKNKIKCTCKVFFNNLPDIMFKSQFVVSRSGASTLSEMTALGKPTILIPYKFAKKNHHTGCYGNSCDVDRTEPGQSRNNGYGWR